MTCRTRATHSVDRRPAVSVATAGRQAISALSSLVSKPNAKAVLKGAAKKVVKNAIRNVVITTSPTWLAGVAIIVLFGLILFTLSTLLGGTIGANEQASAKVISAAGVSASDQATYQQAGAEANIPWTLLPAIVKEQAARGAGDDSHVGPFQMEVTGAFTASDAKDLKKSAQAAARKIRAGLVSNRGSLYGSNSLLLAGAFITKDVMAIPTQNAQSVRDAKSMKVVFVKALSGMPITDPNEAWSAQVYDEALAWSLGQTSQCAATSGTVGVTSSPVANGAFGGLNSAQSTNAMAIYQAAVNAEMGDRGATIGIAVALATTELMNYANDGTSQGTGYFPALRQMNAQERLVAKQSLNYTHDAVGSNLDSMGIFLERPSTNWGDPAALMDPQRESTIFLQRLSAVPGWASTSKPWLAAQSVQGGLSGDGKIYQNQYPLATTLVGLEIRTGQTSTAGELDHRDDDALHWAAGRRRSRVLFVLIPLPTARYRRRHRAGRGHQLGRPGRLHRRPSQLLQFRSPGRFVPQVLHKHALGVRALELQRHVNGYRPSPAQLVHQCRERQAAARVGNQLPHREIDHRRRHGIRAGAVGGCHERIRKH